MISVDPVGNRWTWRMIGACGATLVYTDQTWASDLDAFAAGRAYRAAFWAMAGRIDHRMGACI
jgi:hypothetical protein